MYIFGADFNEYLIHLIQRGKVAKGNAGSRLQSSMPTKKIPKESKVKNDSDEDDDKLSAEVVAIWNPVQDALSDAMKELNELHKKKLRELQDKLCVKSEFEPLIEKLKDEVDAKDQKISNLKEQLKIQNDYNKELYVQFLDRGYLFIYLFSDQ